MAGGFRLGRCDLGSDGVDEGDENSGRSDRLRGIRGAESSWAVVCLNDDMASLGALVTECRLSGSGVAGGRRNGITAEDAEGPEDSFPPSSFPVADVSVGQIGLLASDIIGDDRA